MKLYNGDCLEVMKELPDNSIDFILTDLPYGTTACKWDNIIPYEPIWEQLKRIRKDNTAIALFGTEPFSSHLRLSNLDEYKYDWIWIKSRPANFLNSKNAPLKYNENIHIFSNGNTANKTKKRCIYYPQDLVLVNKIVKSRKGTVGGIGTRPSRNKKYLLLILLARL